MNDVIKQSFCPSYLLRNPHIQTFVGAFLHTTEDVIFNRHRLETPDGDFIDLDFYNEGRWASLDQASPIVLLLPGVGGSARQGYACEAYRQLAEIGIRSVGMNYRSCSGPINSTPQTYHAGATADVALVVDWLRRQYNAPLGIIGFSLGANMLLKFLGEERRDIVAAATISPPFDLSLCAQALSRWRLYNLRIVPNLRRNIERKTHQLSHLIDMSRVANTQTLYDFDDACTAPLHGFQDAEDYYSQCSSNQFLPHIRIPTLLIRSLDDPFFDPNDIPHAIIDKNPYLQPKFINYGGHVGFAKGLPWRLTWWAHLQTARFFEEYLLSYTS